MKWLIVIAILAAIPLAAALVGMALPVKHVALRKFVLRTAPEQVYDIVSGPPDWRGVKYEPLSESPKRWRETGGGNSITYELVEAEPPRRFVTRIADPKLPFGGTWTIEIAPAGQGSEVTITENGEVYNPLFRFVSRFVMGHTATIDKYGRDLKAKLGE